MGSSEPAQPFVSIVITVRNEGRHLSRLLESLLGQEPPFEIVLVDAFSRDATWAIAQAFAAAHPGLVQVVQREGSRGIGRNVGVALARGEWVAFIDGDCFADSNWLRAMRLGFRSSEIVAGRTVAVGSLQYGSLERVELFQRGNDVTYPSCNLGYRRSLFLTLDGFDPRFITAEDIDLNLRAVARGAAIRYEPEALVYHQMRPSVLRFLYQALWNGYGRKQLTEKHGVLWGNYKMRRLLSGQRTPTAWVRLVAALAGYGIRLVTGFRKRLTVDAPATPELAEAKRAAMPSGGRGSSAPEERGAGRSA